VAEPLQVQCASNVSTGEVDYIGRRLPAADVPQRMFELTQVGNDAIALPQILILGVEIRGENHRQPGRFCRQKPIARILKGNSFAGCQAKTVEHLKIGCGVRLLQADFLAGHKGREPTRPGGAERRASKAFRLTRLVVATSTASPHARASPMRRLTPGRSATPKAVLCA
jgi:hypothetical protein